MKTSAFLTACYLSLFLLIAFQCEQRGGVYPEIACTPNATLQGTWRLEAYQDMTTGTLDLDPDPKGRGVVISFSEENGSGKIAGHTAANTVFGSYQRGDSCRLESISFGGTKVGEPNPWSGRVWSAMNDAEAFGQVDEKLYLYFNDRTKRMIFGRE